MKPVIVVSAVNFIEGGPLTIFRDALQTLDEHFSDTYKIIALVHSKALFEEGKISYLEFPEIKTSWLKRLRFEYIDCRALSLKLQPLLWLALHDISPNITAPIRAVYCHNPSPFLKVRLKDGLLDWKQLLFSIFYKFLYGINIRKNNFVIVQQEWLRKEFQRRYHPQEVIVAYPELKKLSIAPRVSLNSECRFFYPAFPRLFKNIELIIQAVRILEERGIRNFRVGLTISGLESPYSAKIKSLAEGLTCIEWLGILKREEVLKQYALTDCLIFPSKMETWGMPISEFQQTGRTILLADLPYAHETIGTYDRVRFFPAQNGLLLAEMMEQFMNGSLETEKSRAHLPHAPFAKDWTALFENLLNIQP